MDTVNEYSKRRKQRLADRMRSADGPEAERLAVLIYETFYKRRSVAMDAEYEKEPASWMTTENGHHVPLDENGVALAGGGGTLTGKDFSDAETSTSEPKSGTKPSASASTPKPSSNSSTKTPKVSDPTKPHEFDVSELTQLEVGTRVAFVDPATKKSTEFLTVKLDNDGNRILVYDDDKNNEAALNLETASESDSFCQKWKDHSVKVEEPMTGRGERITGEAFANYKKQFDNAFAAQDATEFDNKYREKSGEIWSGLSDDDKTILNDYTDCGYEDINAVARGASRGNSSSIDASIDSMTNAINKSELTEDTIVFRGTGAKGLEKLFGIPLYRLNPGNVGELVGRVATDDGFMSTGSAVGTGFTDDEVQLEIMAPAGTKALYVEPFSANGDGKGIKWDGKAGQGSYSDELETILQRGTSVVVLDAKYADGKYHIQMAITEQDYSKSEYSKKRAGQTN